jgi:hypothetical protein
MVVPLESAPVPRRPLQVYLTDTARDGWQALADSHGVTLTALIEAIGLELAEKGEGKLEVDDVIGRARQVMIDRLRRARE